MNAVRTYHESDVEDEHGHLERADQAHISGPTHHLYLGAEYSK
jgi:hypothetical protein